MKKNIEIELRGPLSKKQYSELISFFESNGQKIVEKERVLIDYSTFLKGGIKKRQKDIRLRVTNGIPEIIVKIGSWGGECEQRRELSILSKRGTFDTLVEIFAHLGYHKGILAIRKSHIYLYKNIEFALVEVPNHSFYFEAEKMINEKENADKIIIEIKKVCKNLGLTLFNQKQFFAYIKTLNKEANEVFDFASYTPNYFKNRFDL